MPTDYFGDRTAKRYDENHANMFGTAKLGPAVDVLAGLAGDGAALEFGIGTGRVALPLVERGVHVHGIDLSNAMIAQLKAKPGADEIETVVGDFATTRVDGRFQLVYLVFNAINNLTTQDQQVVCFANAAAHLVSGGCFVIEVGVPDIQRLPFGETFRPFTITPTYVGIDEYDVVHQGLVSHHYDSPTARRWSTLSRSATPGQPSWISWRGSPACGFATAGEAGTASRSPAPAPLTCRCGRGSNALRAVRPPGYEFGWVEAHLERLGNG